MSAYDPRNLVTVKAGDFVRAFDPRTLGVVKQGKVLRTWSHGSKMTVDFGLTGTVTVDLVDVVENLGTRPF